MTGHRSRVQSGYTRDVTILTWFGVLAVTTMLVAYALDDRARAFVLVFAAGCGASSVYGFLVGAWPFGIVEGVWTAVAFRRWVGRAADKVETSTSKPIACDMTALSAGERQRYDELRPRVLSGIEEVRNTPTGFQMRIGSSVRVGDIAEWIEMEHRCCAFLDITLALNNDATTWVELGGSVAIKQFLQEEFSALRVAKRERSA